MHWMKCVVTILVFGWVSGCAPTRPAATPVVVTQLVLATPTAVPTSTQTPAPVLPPLRTPAARAPLLAEGTVEFKILHFNDFHGSLGEETLRGTWVPGAARLAAFIKAERAQVEPGQALVLDAGDWFEGSSFAYPSLGEKVWEFYHFLGVDALTVGNHELFWGAPRFERMLSQAAPAEVLSVNLRRVAADKTCTVEPVLNPYRIFELGAASGPKVRVAVLGVSALNLESYAPTPDRTFCFPDPAPEILKIYDQLLETEKPDLLIALTHNGFAQDQKLAETLNAAGKPVDLIIGGHSHTWLEAPAQVGKTLIVTAGALGRAVGVFDLTYDRATASHQANWRQEVFSPCSPEDPETLAFLGETLPADLPKAACAPAQNPAYTYLIDLEPLSVSVGYWTFGRGVFPASEAGLVEHQVITSHQQTYPSGLFVHAPSNLEYALAGEYSRFVSVISLNESACGDGAAFAVSLDGAEIYHSPNLLPSTAPIPLDLDVRGGKTLTLQTLSGPDLSCDWTIWGDPYLVKAATE